MFSLLIVESKQNLIKHVVQMLFLLITEGKCVILLQNSYDCFPPPTVWGK